MKAKLRITKTQVKSFNDACELEGVTVGESKAIGDEQIVEVDYKQPTQLFNAGLLTERLDPKSKESAK